MGGASHHALRLAKAASLLAATVFFILGPGKSALLSPFRGQPHTSPSHTGLFSLAPPLAPGGVPRVVYQIALGEKYASKIDWGAVKAHILSLNPGWRHELFTDGAAADFITRHYPEHLRLYETLPKPQWRSDLVRYLLLYQRGGAYVDADLRMAVGIEARILPLALGGTGGGARRTASVFVVGALEVEPYEVANGFIVVPPRHPIFPRLVNGMYADSSSDDFGVNVKRMHAELARMYAGLRPLERIEGYAEMEGGYGVAPTVGGVVGTESGSGGGGGGGGGGGRGKWVGADEMEGAPVPVPPAYFLREVVDGFKSYSIVMGLDMDVALESNGHAWPPKVG